MMRKLGWAITAVAAAFLMAATPGFACDLTDCHHRNFFFGDGDTIDLADMYDGEYRVFDVGDEQISAERIGDKVILTMGDTEDARTIDCDITEDTCMVAISDNGSAKIMIRKSRHGEGLHAADHMKVMFGSPDHNVFFSDDDAQLQVALEALDGDSNFVFSGDDGGTFDVVIDALHGADFEWISADPGAHELRFGPSGATLRCPEGDTTMRLSEEELEDGPFYCPRHDIELEKAKGHVMVKEIRVQTRHED